MIDRHAVVERHRPTITVPHPEHVLTVGNGDFAFTADITGMQTFTPFHDQARAFDEGGSAIDTCTMSTWGWHEMPNPDGFTLDDAMSVHQTSRGPVRYPDMFDPDSFNRGDSTDDLRPGDWLHVNPQRIDLGRIGFTFRDERGLIAELGPHDLDRPRQSLDLWTGLLTSEFSHLGERVRVMTTAAPTSSTVAFRIESSLLSRGLLTVSMRFPYASTHFFASGDWEAAHRHSTSLSVSGDRATIDRVMDATEYRVSFVLDRAMVEKVDLHACEIRAVTDVLELVVDFAPRGSAQSAAIPTYGQIRETAEEHWHSFWTTGAAIDLSGSSDPRAHELERRVVLSQWLTAVNCSGTMPPQETGLITNSWHGKSHLEMHWWHGAHFASWGRPSLLERSLPWYRSILDTAEQTARRQNLPGVRWPKQVGPDGRESPSGVGALLIWQQPHPIHLLELVWQASSPEHREQLVEQYLPLVGATMDFMVGFAEPRDGIHHLPSPVMPAQESYDPDTTEDPTFELAYWWWGLEVGQRWRERAGLERAADAARVQATMARPPIVDGVYPAIACEPFTRLVDHPSHLAAFGVLPPTPLIDSSVVAPTLASVLETWDFSTAWGWDFPTMAMTATRLGRPELAIDILLLDEIKNGYSLVGHNSQVPGLLPLYLPGNGGLLAAVALMATSSSDEAALPPGWTWRAEGFAPWPE